MLKLFLLQLYVSILESACSNYCIFSRLWTLCADWLLVVYFANSSKNLTTRALSALLLLNFHISTGHKNFYASMISAVTTHFILLHTIRLSSLNSVLFVIINKQSTSLHQPAYSAHIDLSKTFTAIAISVIIRYVAN